MPVDSLPCDFDAWKGLIPASRFTPGSRPLVCCYCSSYEGVAVADPDTGGVNVAYTATPFCYWPLDDTEATHGMCPACESEWIADGMPALDTWADRRRAHVERGRQIVAEMGQLPAPDGTAAA